jgi:hypothetical protein
MHFFRRAGHSKSLPDRFRQLRDLENTSPQFHEQLNEYFRGDEYQSLFPELQSEDLPSLAGYLDNVSLQAILLRAALTIGVGSRRHFRSCKPRIQIVLV